MVMCWALECNHYNVRETCKFFRFPKNEKLRKKWIRLLRRSDNPGNGAFVCSCHFREGKKENLPEIFSFNKDKKFGPGYYTPEKRKRVKKNLIQDYDTLPSTSTQSQSPKKAIPCELDENLPSTSTQSQSPQRTVFCESDQNLSSTSGTSQRQEGSETNFLSANVLEAEIYLLKLENERLHKDASESGKFCYEIIANNEKMIRVYTGLPTRKIFEALYNLLKNIEINYIYGSRVCKIDKIDQLLMTFMKLRLNLSHADLAFRFKVSEATVSNVVITWVHILYEILYKQLMDKIPSRNKNKSCLPNCFSTFTNYRIILDCTEISVAVVRKSLLQPKKSYSSYKHRNIFKALIGTAPNGVITFVSDLYAGSTSDKMIVSNSGVLDQLEAGDLILADKGFLIEDILPPGVHLNIPPHFTEAQIQETKTIARARIHVERAIGRIKMYKILDFIPHTMSKYADIIFKAIAAITNLHYPLIKETESKF